MEYGYLAKYYDIFYCNKNYDKEIKFLTSIIKDKQTILDAGCGTGNHLIRLKKLGYKVDGFDLSTAMLDVAKSKSDCDLYIGNIVDFSKNKYDVIISMFAVFNHLASYAEFEASMHNLLNSLNDNGILIIDLHNGRKSGSKIETINEVKREMIWNFNEENMIEYTKIIYSIGDKVFEDSHIFKIYDIYKLKEILAKSLLNYKIYENYSFEKASNQSKNIQLVITK